jgi:hypothetical protein
VVRAAPVYGTTRVVSRRVIRSEPSYYGYDTGVRRVTTWR